MNKKTFIEVILAICYGKSIKDCAIEYNVSEQYLRELIREWVNS